MPLGRVGFELIAKLDSILSWVNQIRNQEKSWRSRGISFYGVGYPDWVLVGVSLGAGYPGWVLVGVSLGAGYPGWVLVGGMVGAGYPSGVFVGTPGVIGGVGVSLGWTVGEGVGVNIEPNLNRAMVVYGLLGNCRHNSR
jgi:hypothetical protein